MPKPAKVRKAGSQLTPVFNRMALEAKLMALSRTAGVDGAWGGGRAVYLTWIEERRGREEPLRNFVVEEKWCSTRRDKQDVKFL